MRREFPRKIRAEIILRATNADGRVVCEGCGLVLGLRAFEIDHTIPEALIVDKSKPLAADDGKLLGVECCHRGGRNKTKDDIRTIRKSDRQRDRHLCAMKPTSRPIPGSRRSGWKIRVDGTVERRR